MCTNLQNILLALDVHEAYSQYRTKLRHLETK